MKAAQPQFIVTKSEAQTIITNWVCATEEFHQHYSQISKVINGMSKRQVMANSISYPQANLRELMKLRQHMSDVLATLLMEMSKPTSAQQSNQSTSPSKPGQIATHTRLIQDINHKVGSEFKRLKLAQA